MTYHKEDERLLFVILLVPLLTTVGFGQVPASSAPQFSSRTELVTVPAVVTDSSGAHITSLKKEDFVVLEDGKEQKTSVFEELRSTPSTVRHATSQPNQFTNRLSAESPPSQLNIVVLDLVNTPEQDQVYARQQLLKFLEQLDPRQPTSLLLITRFGLRVVHDFAGDPKVLKAALEKFHGVTPQLVLPASQEPVPLQGDAVSQQVAQLMQLQQQTEERMESFQQRVAITMTLEQMQQIAQSFAGLPGRKTLLWASAGFPFNINGETMNPDEGSPTQSPRERLSRTNVESLSDILPLYEKTWRWLNQAQIAVYPVDVRGLVNTGFANASMATPNSNFASRARWQQLDTIATFKTVAEATGGRAFYNGNDLQSSFNKAIEDSTSYYMLGYYLDRKDKKPGWHKLQVKLRHSAGQVRARTGFFLTDLSRVEEKDEKAEMQLALASPVDAMAIPIAGKWLPATAAEETGKKKAVFVLTLPANFADVDESDQNHLLLDIAARAHTPTGQTAGEMAQNINAHLKPESLAQIRNSGLDYKGALTLSPGEYIVRFVVRDRLSGRIGSAASIIQIAP